MIQPEVPRIFQEFATMQATLPMWQRRLAGILARAQNTTLQKISASDDGLMTLSVYKPGDDRSLIVFSIRKGSASITLEKSRPASQPKPNGIVQLVRKHLTGRRIISTWCALRPMVVAFEFAPPSPDDADREERLEGPNILLIDLDVRPARVCLVKRHAEVPQRYGHVIRAFRDTGLSFFESYCEWSLDSTKTKHRITFEEPLVTFSFLPTSEEKIAAEPNKVDAEVQSTTAHNLESSIEGEVEMTLTRAFSYLPPHVRRAAKTRYQFLERRLTRQKADFPPCVEIERLTKRAQGLQANLYLWPKGSSTWYVPADLIAEFSLPAFIKLKAGQKPGDLMEEAFHELERTKRRQQELETRIAQSETALTDFSNLVMQAAQEIDSALRRLEADAHTTTIHLEKQLNNFAPRVRSEAAHRICQICDVPWLQISEKKKLAQQEQIQRLPWRSYKSFTGEFIRVGKSAQDSDAMIKAMPTNHYWLHVLTGEGSHVWLERPRGSKPTPRAIREAAILALHFSRQTKAMSGEVRFAVRSDIERKKNLAAGKVLIRRCETLMCKYNDEELQRILATYHDKTSTK
jgi:predicted ribosome quality control (RQC) complex YloA/Tae2 family protein